MEYYSPSSIKKFFSNREAFYLDYIVKLPRLPQSKPMAVGSAFDAFIKSYISKELLWQGHPAYCTFTDLFESSVESHNRDFALEAGKVVFEHYLIDGFSRLREEMSLCDLDTVIMEGRCSAKFDDITLLGYPDLYYKIPEGVVILDWKVNGYCGKTLTSPKKGHLKHKKYVKGECLSVCNADWALQLLIYGWILGGRDASIHAHIDQITGPASRLRTFHFRNRISKEYGDILWEKIQYMHECIVNDDIIANSDDLDALVGVDEWLLDAIR